MNKALIHTHDVGRWLDANLGRGCLAPLTGTDARALLAAVQVVELWTDSHSREVAEAFGLIVRQMQPHTRRLAFHAIAKVSDWGHRQQLWDSAGLPQDVTHTYGCCKFEPE